MSHQLCRSKDKTNRVYPVLIAAILAFGLAACSAPLAPSPQNVTINSIPEFSGPYSAEFRQAWVESDSEFVQEVVFDQSISDQEWAEVETRLASCLSTKGLKFNGFDADGSYQVGLGGLSGDEANALLPECESRSGERWINSLRLALSSNPDNTPQEQLMVACMIRVGVVSPSYTEKSYLQDVTQLSFPYLDPKSGESGFWACNENPAFEADAR